MIVFYVHLWVKVLGWLLFKSYYIFLAGLSQFYNWHTWDVLKDYWQIMHSPPEMFRLGDWVGPSHFFHANFWLFVYYVFWFCAVGNLATYFEASQIMLGRLNDSAELMVRHTSPLRLVDRRKYSNFHEDWNISFEVTYHGVTYDDWFVAKYTNNADIGDEDPYPMEDYWFMEDDYCLENTGYADYSRLVYGMRKPWFGIIYQNKALGDYFDYAYLSVISSKDFSVYTVDHIEKNIPIEYLYYYRSPFDQDLYEYETEAEQVYAAMHDPMGLSYHIG